MRQSHIKELVQRSTDKSVSREERDSAYAELIAISNEPLEYQEPVVIDLTTHPYGRLGGKIILGDMDDTHDVFISVSDEFADVYQAEGNLETYVPACNLLCGSFDKRYLISIYQYIVSVEHSRSVYPL